MYKWLLDKMIFLFREMSEETCRKENPYQKEYEDTLQEFQIKYGIFGEKLEEGKKNKLGRVVHLNQYRVLLYHLNLIFYAQFAIITAYNSIIADLPHLIDLEP